MKKMVITIFVVILFVLICAGIWLQFIKKQTLQTLYHDDPPGLITTEESAALQAINDSDGIRCVGRFNFSLPDAFRQDRRVSSCLGIGSLGPVNKEKAIIGYYNAENAVSVSLSIEVLEKNYSSLSDYIEESKSYSVASGGKLNILKDTELKINGFLGREARLKIEDNRGTQNFFKYIWVFQGVKGDAMRPEILIEADGPNSALTDFNITWESLLESLSPREA